MSNLVKHARAELARLAEEEPALKASVLKAVEGFASYPGHSGGSAEVARQMVARLLSFQALSPLTADPAEWEDRTEQSGYPLWQNTRDSTAFSDDGGQTYWLLAEGDSAPRHTSVAP